MTLVFIIVYKATGEMMNIRLLFILLMAVFLMIMVITDLENYFIPDITQIGMGILVSGRLMPLPEVNLPEFSARSSTLFFSDFTTVN